LAGDEEDVRGPILGETDGFLLIWMADESSKRNLLCALSHSAATQNCLQY
jgi:hypothetical protein